MAIYDIVKFPNPILTTPANPVKSVTPNVLKVLDNLAETMKYANGIGLAAPQVNILRRLAVVDVEDGRGRLDLINPVIVEGRDEVIGPDGCLSIPGLFGDTMRYRYIRVRMLDRSGQEVEIEETDFRARAIQHEIDHLDGILFTSKAIRLYREEEMRRETSQKKG
ncbi:peptide deformylase [Ferroacidibacillus organovorans]|uniref:Peptide deformylase n=2 Tax=Ferroacidibacillus organovorans TaxID=1765683 RepID=A0A1V4EWZ9_9BACL|nr:peptide deformylase [Ferroacidibacillus organovorans]OAG87249.1 peptide deformylase [Ferroacidibacillus organovorans]OPG17467.1 peptide deformylase [Ferroacidibacillus organovorans]